jgi:hypothetical protein
VYRKFIKGYADITARMNQLLKKEAKWEWSETLKEDMRNLKGALCAYPVLRMPDFEKQFYLYRDASGVALAAILGQKDEEGNDYVCEYASRCLNDAEKNVWQWYGL